MCCKQSLVNVCNQPEAVIRLAASKVCFWLNSDLATSRACV